MWRNEEYLFLVIPAQAGIQEPQLCLCGPWIPAFAGMTAESERRAAIPQFVSVDLHPRW